MTAFEEGEKAAQTRATMCACPYSKGSESYAEWMRGFRHAARRQDATKLTHG